MTQVIIDFPGIRDAILRDHYANLPRAEGSASPSMETLLGAYFSAFEGNIELKVALSFNDTPTDGARQLKEFIEKKDTLASLTNDELVAKVNAMIGKRIGSAADTVDLHNWTPDTYGKKGDA